MHTSSPPSDTRPKQDNQRELANLAWRARKITIRARLAYAHAARCLAAAIASRSLLFNSWLALVRFSTPNARRLYYHPPLAHTTRSSTETLRHLARSQNTSRTSCCSPLPRACRLPVGSPSHVSRAPPERTPPAPQAFPAPPSTPHHPNAAPGQADRRPTAACCADPAAHRRGMSHEPDLT